MTPERWQRIAELFAAASERESSARSAFLSEATKDDPSLVAEVESLLASDQAAGSFLSGPALTPTLAEALAAPGPNVVGRQIGPYRVLGEIGHGGMGAVYRAVREDDQYRKQVAIKLVRGGHDTASVLRRFKAERQILANLEHPNIARLVDGGRTEEGWPYFSMEYVEGQSIDRYCASLGVRETLELFRTVCAAVQYAHQRLVIHRDLKPSNILVSTEGVPKLLDFGIAKLLDPSVEASGEEPPATVGPLMTPEYASPEQVKGEAVTTASDVYSLGVLLYELLARRRAHDVRSGSPEELMRLVCQETPPAPSLVAGRPRSRELAGDLDTIVLKAIRKEPSRRYATVGELSGDLQRHLAGLPVLARRDTLRYRSGKFVRRHRPAVAVAGLLALSLVGGIVATARQARIAEANRARAEHRFDDVRKLTHTFLFEVHDAIAELPGATKAREILVKRGLEYVDSLAREAGDDVTLQRDLARAYDRLADLQGKVNGPNLGDTAGARASYAKATAMREALAAAHPEDGVILLDLAQSYSTQGEMRWMQGDRKGSAESHAKAVRVAESLLAKSPDDVDYKTRLGLSLAQYGEMVAAGGDFAGGLASVRKGLALLERLAAANPKNTEAQSRVAVINDIVGEIVQEANPDRAVALAVYRKSLAINERLALAEPQNARWRHDVAASHSGIGSVLEEMGDSRGALAAYRKAVAILAPLSDADPSNLTYRMQVAALRTLAGTLLAKTGATNGAFEELERARPALEPLLRADPTNLALRVAVARLDTGLGHAEAGRGNWRLARSHFEKSRLIWLDLRQHGTTTGSFAALPEELAREIARCDAALARPRRVTAQRPAGNEASP